MKHPHIDLPALKAKMFHTMWGELAGLGKLTSDYKVLCPICLFPKAENELTLEHIIPKRALKKDPSHLRKVHSITNRAGLTLLCQSCNGLKGKYYDPVIEPHFYFPMPALKPEHVGLDFKARRTLAYLAAFRELGYSYILSGRKFEALRRDIQNPYVPSSLLGIDFLTGFHMQGQPNAYFDGWCDLYEGDKRIQSVFGCFDDGKSDYIQVRARHLCTMMPAGKRTLIVPDQYKAGPKFEVKLSGLKR